MTPTEAGQRLLRHARRASAAMRAAEADLHALAEGEAGTLRVGTFQSAGVRLLPGAMRRYVERWPNVQVRLSEAGYNEELLGLLERGDLDLAFVIENDDPAFERVHVLTDPYVLLAPSGSEIARSERPTRRGRSPAAADRLSQRSRRCRARPPIARARARHRLSLRRGRDRPGSRRSRDRLHRRASARGGRGRGRRGARGPGRSATPDHDRLARGSDPHARRTGVHRDRDGDRGRDRRGLRSRRDESHPEARETAAMRLLSVVGNRPQFIKSAPLSLALRDARDRGDRAAHRPALRPRAVAGLLRGARPRRAATTGSTCTPPTRARWSPGSRGARAASSPTGCSSTATRTRRSPARGRPPASVPGRPRRGRPAQRRPLDARGAQPDRGRPHLAALLLCPDERSRRRCAARTSAAGSRSSAT